ncbi:MAG: hypothetical protein ACK5DG_01695 [Chitinophagaceae bacterium]|jgi:hypothetical protein
MQKEIHQNPQVEAIGQHIGYEAGEEMVKRFYDKHPEQQYGSIMGREMIEKILAQPGCAGIVIMPAYNETGIRQCVLVGIDENKKPILQYNVVNASGQIVSEEGLVADRHVTEGWAL